MSNPLLDEKADTLTTADDATTDEDALSQDELQQLMVDTAGPELEPDNRPKTPQELDDERAERLVQLIAPVHDSSEWTKVLAYADQGKGKTTWACRAPKPLLIAIETGQKALLNLEETFNVPVMKFKSVRQVEDFAELLIKEHPKFDNYETIILDTVSELEKTVISNRVFDQYSILQGARDRYTPEGKDYQNSGEHLRQIAAALRQVERNVIFLAQEKEVEDKASGRLLYRPDLAPKVTKKIGEYCDLVCRFTTDLDQDGVEHFYMQTRGDLKVMAKSRIKLLPTLIEGSSFNLVHRANLKQIKTAKEKGKNSE